MAKNFQFKTAITLEVTSKTLQIMYYNLENNHKIINNSIDFKVCF